MTAPTRLDSEFQRDRSLLSPRIADNGGSARIWHSLAEVGREAERHRGWPSRITPWLTEWAQLAEHREKPSPVDADFILAQAAVRP